MMARHVSTCRSSASEGCSCGWCEVGHLKGQQLVNRLQDKSDKIGRPKSANPEPLHLLLPPKLLGRDKEDSGVEKVCKDCKAALGGDSLMCAPRGRDR